MIITGTRLTRSTLPCLYWWGDFAAYRNAGGIILAHIPTGNSCYFQPGEDANSFEDAADAIMATADENDSGSWDGFCSDYLDVMIVPDEAGGRPSSDGGFWAFFAGGEA